MATTRVRKIALLDLDAFFAAVEVLDNPELRNQPFAVGGGGERGVVATCNYLARQFGVRSAMPGHQARKLCPQLIFVKPNMAKYKAMSKRVYEILLRYTDLVEPASIDEFYLDLTANTAFQGSATRTLEAIRSELRSIGITASAGVSSQKMVAKIASEENKPDGQFVVPPEQIVNYLAALPIRRIPGVGPKSQERLAAAGFNVVRDIQQCDPAKLQRLLGDHAGMLLFQRCLGVDDRPVSLSRTRKQISVEETLHRDFHHVKEAERFLETTLLPALRKRLQQVSEYKHMENLRWQDIRAKAQTVKLKFHDFNQTTVSKVSNRVSPALYYQLLQEAWPRSRDRSVRLLGLGITLPDPDEQRQLELDLE
ncbi:DNA polymerase IV [Aliidiomarina haloalkalitolerans]|uniref:DNA polymerase IV n=1 Tax=Aliidiomarina haloalkalitolerans TaxID=859059 RepID=A0A432VVM2_9GAMM|nr:DNA polymerase IV [Aliidiomarina haloalkalitolerans]RUO20650.1 DNA polymerase IV [Aliidiomarina haloalkalitolerans]